MVTARTLPDGTLRASLPSVVTLRPPVTSDETASSRSGPSHRSGENVTMTVQAWSGRICP